MTKSRWPRIKHYKRRLGALERRSFKLVRQKQFLRTPWGDGLALFHRPGEIAEHLRRFEELGLADLLEAPDARCDDDEENWDRMWKQAGKMAGDIERIRTALGADHPSIEIFGKDDPASSRNFDERDAEAWFLTNFAFFYSQQNVPGSDMGERLRWAHALGRLVEWWRFRREGHDARSVSRMGSDIGMEKVRAGGKAENERRADMARRWVDWACQRAQALKAENSKLTRKQLAGLIYTEIESRTVRAKAVGGDCGHDPEKPRRFCFVCSRPTEKKIYDKLEKFPER